MFKCDNANAVTSPLLLRHTRKPKGKSETNIIGRDPENNIYSVAAGEDGCTEVKIVDNLCTPFPPRQGYLNM